MNDHWKDLLASWEVPEPDPELKNKVLGYYRQQFPGQRPSTWRRLITARIPIPLPVAAAVALLLVTASYFAMRPKPSNSPSRTETVQTLQPPSGSDHSSAQNAASVRDSRSDANPSNAKAIAPAGKPVNTVRSQPSQTTRKMSTITLQGDQETIQCLTGSEYRPIAIPKIYAGLVFNPSEVR
jgi:hypothetical protein